MAKITTKVDLRRFKKTLPEIKNDFASRIPRPLKSAILKNILRIRLSQSLQAVSPVLGRIWQGEKEGLGPHGPQSPHRQPQAHR